MTDISVIPVYRLDIRSLDKRIVQMEFLSKNGIDSVEQLQAKKTAQESKIVVLQADRQRMYRTAPGTPQILEIATVLKPLRRDLKCAKKSLIILPKYASALRMQNENVKIREVIHSNAMPPSNTQKR